MKNRARRITKKVPGLHSKAAVQSVLEKVSELKRVLPPLSQVEQQIEKAKEQYGHQLMEDHLKSLPEESGLLESCPRCKKPVRLRTKDVPRRFLSTTGAHRICRNYYYCEPCKHGFYPRDIALGLPEDGEITLALEEKIVDFALNEPYNTAEERWALHYRSPASSNLFRRVVDRVAKRFEATNPAVLQAALSLPKAEAAEVLVVMTDGSMIPMRGGHWKEVKLGAVFRAENHLRGTSSKRGQVSDARYVAVLGAQQEFKTSLEFAIQAETLVPAKQIVWLGDGAPGNWNLASTLCPQATQILDWYHAVEHGMDLGSSLLGEQSPYLVQWKARMTHLLYEGKTEELLKEVMACIPVLDRGQAGKGQKQTLTRFVQYVRKNAARMQYRMFVDRGFMIGSGIVESAHRHVIQERMKRAGQHWSMRRGAQMAKLRAAYKTAGRARFHQALTWAYRNAPLSKIPLSSPTLKRRASNR